MERKANRFVHKLAEGLLKEHLDENISEAPAMKHHFTKAVEAMKVGKLKQELSTHMSLYAKKFCHIILTNSRKKGREPSSPHLQETSSPHLASPHPSCVPEQTQVEETTELPSHPDRVGFAFNLYASDEVLEDKVKLPELNSKKASELLSLLCVPSGYDAYQLINSKYFSGEDSYRNLKQATQVLIGQKQPEITLRYLSAVVKNISKDVERAVSQEDKNGCADLLSYINKLLMLTRFRSTMTKTSFPDNIKPSIDDLLAALLSMSVDLGAVASRSAEDLPKFAKQTTLQVLLHLDHSPSHQLDVLLQLTSSSEDAAFLEPLYRSILCCHRPMPSNVIFIKFVCAVRQAKKILGSTIPEVVNSLVQEACLRSPPNLAVWLQEGSSQWLSNIKDKSRKNGNAEIVKYLLNSASEEEINDLLEFLTTSEESVEAEEEDEDPGDLFFVDKSKDDVEGILPEDSQIFERDNEDDEDSDLEEQINLADELLAELDRGLLKGRDAEENEKGSSDEMEDEEDEGDDEKDAQVDEGEKMELSEVSPLAGTGNGGQVSPVFHFPQGQEVSFEEKRALDLKLLQPEKISDSAKKRKLSAKSHNNQDKPDTGGVDEAGHGNEEVVKVEELSSSPTKRNTRQRREKSNSTSKGAKLSATRSRNRSVSEDDDDLDPGQGMEDEENIRGAEEAGQGERLRKSQQQERHSLNGPENEDTVEALDNTLSHDVIPSSEIDERDSSLHHHERLSFPMLSEKQRKEDSPNRRKKLKKRKSVEDRERNSVSTPKIILHAEKPDVASDRDENTTGEKEDGGKEEEGLENQVSKFLKEIRDETRKAVGSSEPRRSSRIRQASTSSTEGGPRTKEFRRTRMSLRTRRSLQK